MTKERIDNTEPLVGRTINLIFEKLDRQSRAFWLETFDDYNNLPKGTTSKERKIARNFVTKTAEELLQNPRDIIFAQEALTNRKNNARTQDPKQQFVQRLKGECLTLIKDKWENVKPEQLAQLVRIYADNNDPSQGLAKEMLRNHFRGPKSKRQRIDAFYNFTFSILDLVGDQKALNEGMIITLHGTDILPRNPSLIEQAVLLSLPYGEEEEDFKKLIIAKYVINQVSSVRPQEFKEYHRANGNFLRTDEKATREWNKKLEKVTKEIERVEANEFIDIMMSFIRITREPLSETRKQGLKKLWPYSVAFNETDPLYQESQKVLSQRSVL